MIIKARLPSKLRATYRNQVFFHIFKSKVGDVLGHIYVNIFEKVLFRTVSETFCEYF